MAADPMLEISSALADIAETMERKDKTMAATMKAAVAEISAPLADLLEAIQKNGPETAKAIAAALGALRQAAPVVNVEPPSVVLEMPETAGWRFEIDYKPNGQLQGLTAKRLGQA